MIPQDKLPSWIFSPIADEDAKNIVAVSTKTPDFKKWTFGIYQLPLWLGDSRKGKKKTDQRREALKHAKKQIAAKRRAEQAK